ALEFVDDVANGDYRDVRWRSVFVLAGAMLYALNPADVIPDALPLIGSIDDLLVIGLATRAARSQLEDYARAKGYPVEEYFGQA
ncbi:MAG: YkvA family protein, partial [Myxococcota bacterium]